MTIRDNVEAVHRLLTEELKVTHLKAVIGFSMGAQQAFQWAVSYPTYMDRAVATSGTAKTYGHGIVRYGGGDRGDNGGREVSKAATTPRNRRAGINAFWDGLGGMALFAAVVEGRAVADE